MTTATCAKAIRPSQRLPRTADDRRVNAFCALAERVVMDTFTLRWPRWPIIRAFGRNPLVRVTDRVEAVILTSAVVGILRAGVRQLHSGSLVVYGLESPRSRPRGRSRTSVMAWCEILVTSMVHCASSRRSPGVVGMRPSAVRIKPAIVV